MTASSAVFSPGLRPQACTRSGQTQNLWVLRLLVCHAVWRAYGYIWRHICGHIECHTQPHTLAHIRHARLIFFSLLIILAVALPCHAAQQTIIEATGLPTVEQPFPPIAEKPAAEQATMPAPAKGAAASTWEHLEPGLAYNEFQLNESTARLAVIRLDPAYFDFVLCAGSEDGRPARALSRWSEEYDLAAAVNASMYLPDGSTSTGYMRQGAHINNKRLVRQFGAFFVAGTADGTQPAAAILDRDDPSWEEKVKTYRLVIQNYRMISADRRILWSPGGPLYSISAVAQDGDGHILFLHCREPIEAYTLAQQLLHLPLNVRTVMYVEGGAQAGLLLRSPALQRDLAGIGPVNFLVTGNLKAMLPNVLGARRKPQAIQPEATAKPTAEATAEATAKPTAKATKPKPAGATPPSAAAPL